MGLAKWLFEMPIWMLLLFIFGFILTVAISVGFIKAMDSYFNPYKNEWSGRKGRKKRNK